MNTIAAFKHLFSTTRRRKPVSLIELTVTGLHISRVAKASSRPDASLSALLVETRSTFGNVRFSNDVRWQSWTNLMSSLSDANPSSEQLQSFSEHWYILPWPLRCWSRVFLSRSKKRSWTTGWPRELVEYDSLCTIYEIVFHDPDRSSRSSRRRYVIPWAEMRCTYL